MKTTLLEGAVKVLAANNKTSFLKSDQQVQIDAKGINIIAAETDAVMAWKNGMFRFSNTDLATIMKQVSCWYDVETGVY
jgi:transmembrane sensor